MRPMIVTAGNGEKRRLNPMQIIGWREADVPAAEGRPEVYKGCIIALPTGPVGVRESEEQIDWLFALATGEPSHVKTPVQDRSHGLPITAPTRTPGEDP